MRKFLFQKTHIAIKGTDVNLNKTTAPLRFNKKKPKISEQNMDRFKK